MAHEKFHYKNIEEIMETAKALNLRLPFAGDTKILAQPLKIRNVVLQNRLGVAPMEGADSTADGSPSQYTFRRYTKAAEGGSGIIWFEAISMVEEGRSSATQLLLTRDNVDEYKRLTEAVKEAGRKANGF